MFTFKSDPGERAKSLFANVRGTVRIPNPTTVYLRLPASYFEPRTLITILRKILAEKQ